MFSANNVFLGLLPSQNKFNAQARSLMYHAVAAGAAEAARAEKVEGGIGASVRSRSGADVQRTRSWSLGGSGSLGVFIDRILIQRLLFMQRHPKIGNHRTASC